MSYQESNSGNNADKERRRGERILIRVSKTTTGEPAAANTIKMRGINSKDTFKLKPLSPGQNPVAGLPKYTTELPFFYLTKRKDLLAKNIAFASVDESARPIIWNVKPNRDPQIGAPGIDAHAVWVLLILPAIENERRNRGMVPQILPLGGMRQCLRQLGWGIGGHQARRLLHSLNQIGAAWCEAEFFLSVRTKAGECQYVPIKGRFSRMSIYALGEKHLTDAELAAGKFDFNFDLNATLYVQLHQLEVAAHENQEHRYVDNQYMFSVEPTGRRWLEILGSKIFGVVKNGGQYCEARYSWYVKQHHTLQRQHAHSRVATQMNRVVADHMASGYILKPEYRTIQEPGEEVDFIIRYTPGPMAHESTNRIRASFKRQNHLSRASADATDAMSDRQTRVPLSSVRPEILAKLGKRGIGETDARKLLAKLPYNQAVLDQLEWADSEITKARGKIANPAGFYISILRRNATPPPTFETSAKRLARQDEERRRALSRHEEEQVKAGYENYCVAEIEQYMSAMPLPELEALRETKRGETKRRFPNLSPALIDRSAEREVRNELRKLVQIIPFEEFVNGRGQKRL